MTFLVLPETDGTSNGTGASRQFPHISFIGCAGIFTKQPPNTIAAALTAAPAIPQPAEENVNEKFWTKKTPMLLILMRQARPQMGREFVASSSAMLYILVALSMGSMPSFTGLSIYQDKESCVAAAATMTPALSPKDKSVKFACLSAADLDAIAKAAGI